ncbi:MAG TPA: hypothetical protein PKL65_01160 [Bacteroidales bacterium]|jgi:YD repeat-containing protein|nr:hypothetical protein [Bacteroidales bacterium]HNR40816.1 hypothetical protein [Bacteroidales bacterium]HQG76027.1 hypothetical protein [Bacteroidales bacterium]
MKHLRTFFLSGIVITAIAFLWGCSQNQPGRNVSTNVKYYRNILFSETPWDIERGSRELTPGQAAEINSYKFTYDDEGRLLSVEFSRNDELLGYSALGGAARITYEYTGNKQIKHFFDENNQPMESAGVFTAEYTLDDKGIRTGLKFFDRNGQPVENRNKINNYVWKILDDGMLQEKRYNLAGEETIMNPFCPFYELRFSYNDKGYVTRMANYMNDALYNCTAENCGDIGVSYFTFEPNEHGDVESFSVFNVLGLMSNLYWGWSKRVSRYDENGYVLETVYYDQDNEFVSGNMVPVTQYSYDRHGALTEVRNMDKDRNIINSPDNGAAITEYKYDEKGNRTSTIRYNKDHQVITQ